MSNDIFIKNGVSELAAPKIVKDIATDAAITATLWGIGSYLGIAALTTIGGPVSIALALGGIVYTIVDALSSTDDSVDDLIGALEDLDIDGTDAKIVVDSWIDVLKKYKPMLAIPAITENVFDMAEQSAKRINALRSLINNLEIMNRTWPQVKTQVDDWKFLGKYGDIGEAETILKQTLEKTKLVLEDVKKAAKEEANSVIQKYSEKYITLSQEVLQLKDELQKMMDNKEPRFSNDSEKKGYAIAYMVVNEPEKVNLKSLDVDIEHVRNLKEVLEKAISIVKERKKAHTKQNNIKKTALILDDGTVVGDSVGASSPDKDVVDANREEAKYYTKKIQKSINKLLDIYCGDCSPINEDGIYGPKTAEAIIKLFDSSKQIEKIFNDRSMGRDVVSNVKAMGNSTIKFMQAVFDKILSTLSQKQDGGEKEKTQDVNKQDEPKKSQEVFGCPVDKKDLTMDETDACLKYMVVKDPLTGARTSAHAFLQYWAGASERNERVDIINDFMKMSGVSPLPRQWTEWGSSFVSYITERFGNKPKGTWHLI